MVVSITYFRIRSIIRGFSLFAHERRLKKQMKEMNCRDYKMWAFLKDVYTMTLWDNEEVMKEFTFSGAHKESMKQTARLGVEFRSITFKADKLPSWKEAKKRLWEEGRVITYK